MYLTQKEIFGQYEALRRTYDLFLAKRSQIKSLFKKYEPRSLTFIGAGSGYTLCHSGEISTKLRLNLAANAVAAGDLLVNFNHYKKLLEGTVIIAPSRSGGTSEVVINVERAKKMGVPTLAIAAKEDSPLSELAELTLEIPWAFDESVCQTRTVTNFYAANLILIGILADDEKLLAEIDAAVKDGERFMAEYKGMAETIAKEDWDKVVILADSELEGIGAEAALAFAEIPQLPANYYHVLDVRHGPMVLIDEKTLVVAALSPEENELQLALIQDLRKNKARVIAVSMGEKRDLGANREVFVPQYENFAVLGIPFIFIPQAIAFYKALERGLNPDQPGGLAPWIDLGGKEK